MISDEFAVFESCTWAVEPPPARSAVWPLWFWHYGGKYTEPVSICRTPSPPRPPAALSATQTRKQTNITNSLRFVFLFLFFRSPTLTSDTDDRRSTFINTAETPAVLLIFSAQIHQKWVFIIHLIISFLQTRGKNRRPVSIWKFPFPKILFFSGVFVERMILSTTVQFCNVLTRPTASAICRSASRRQDTNKINWMLSYL